MIKKPVFSNPADVAREVFIRLAKQRIAPTPDAYRDAYNDIAGVNEAIDADTVLAHFAEIITTTPGEVGAFGKRFSRSAKEKNWLEYEKNLKQLVESYLTPASRVATLPPVKIISAPPPAVEKISEIFDGPQTRLLREMLMRTLNFAVVSLLQDAPELATESERLAALIKEADTDVAFNDISIRLNQLCFKVELKTGDIAEQQELLLRLFKLLLENVSKLLDEDSWLQGQINGVQSLLSGPMNHNVLQEATRSLKDVIYKQGKLKHSLTEAKVTVKTMMLTFIDRLGEVAISSADYHQKIDVYSKQISQAQGIAELNRIIDDVMRDTRTNQADALRARDDMLAARQQAQDAETRIITLESKLEQLTELVREDQLTGSLNRRGLDDVLEREFNRADRRGFPLCIALLDLDDFKNLNDTHGHVAGDEALIYLVRVIKETLRSMDVIGRFGGEEFLIVLPDTKLEDAAQTVTRVQRELTKQIFMHQHMRLLITFSAGVALRLDGEDGKSLIQRADTALYRAKREGKNRVVCAE